MTISQFVVEQADKTRAQVGFWYEARPGAPSTFPVLKEAFARAAATGQPLPVANENSDSVIYTDPEVNYAMRFWHDVNHVRRRLSFELADELELALWHLSVLEGEGFTSDSTPWKLLHADLIGQATVMAYARRFPLDQQRFAEGCLAGGFDVGLLRELRREAATDLMTRSA
jgi:hypothetical protein